MAPPLTYAEAAFLAEQFDTPLYLYDEATLRAQAQAALGLPAPFGLTVRYAMKAWPNAAVLQLFDRLGLHFDASSGFEVERLQRAGVAPEKISLSTQELPANFAELIRAGVRLNACSLGQLRRYAEAFPGSRVGVRFNPGLGSGHANRTNVGGPGSSFGIWHAALPEVQALAAAFNLTLERVHSHIGSGSDPAVWTRAAELTLQLVAELPSVQTVNLGGGFKVARMPHEKSTDLAEVGAAISDQLRQFASRHGRKLHLEIEPGTFLVATAGQLVCRVQDVVDTGPEGYTFYKLNAGMTDILRPTLYGAQHPIDILHDPAEQRALQPAVIVGHCCESGDILTPAPGDPEGLHPRTLPTAQVGDFCVIGGAGAYCAAMPAGNYNSFPLAAEVWRRTDGTFALIRRRQSLKQILANEFPLD